MTKYVLDTNVLLHDGNALYHFEDNDVYIAEEVVRELDTFKRGSEQINANARQVTRQLKDLTAHGVGDEGITLNANGGKLYFLYGTIQAPTNDDAIIARAQALSDAVLVSKDANMMIRARLAGLQAEDYRHDQVQFDLYSFFQRDREISVDKTLIDTLYKDRSAQMPPELVGKLRHNQYVSLKEGSQSIFARRRGNELEHVHPPKKTVEGIKARNREQAFLFHACLDPTIQTVAALGPAGTGKTLIALAAGWHQIMRDDHQRYDRMVVVRPTLGGHGYLPGGLNDKIAPYFRPIQTAMRKILGDPHYGLQDGQFSDRKLDDFLEFRTLEFMQGDTFDDTYLVLDEAQNITRSEIKVVGTRLGTNSKLVLTGDPDPFQIRNPYIDERSNGLTVATNLLQDKWEDFACILLEKVERGEIAAAFAKYL